MYYEEERELAQFNFFKRVELLSNAGQKPIMVEACSAAGGCVGALCLSSCSAVR